MEPNVAGSGPFARMRGSRAFGLLALIGCVYLAILSYNAVKTSRYIGQGMRDTITISAEGKVVAVPDIASISVGVQTEKRTVAEAQKENASRMNAILAKLRELGIVEADIKTVNYSISPQYDYLEGRQVERGFQVAQNLEVKIRDLDKIGQVLATASELGANQIGGISFTIDEPEELRQQARLKALAAAKQKAEALSLAAGVKLGRIVSFSEQEAGNSPIFYRDAAAFGLAGESAPSISSGSQDVTMNVSVQYELLP